MRRALGPSVTWRLGSFDLSNFGASIPYSSPAFMVPDGIGEGRGNLKR
jgi:hypothetical protein